MRTLIRGLACTLILAALPVVSQAGVFVGVSVNIAPPALPVYTLPAVPGPGYIWTPGYWAWDGGYYWVPGTWVLAPVGMLWTPGYWGWAGGAYAWHGGYWGPHVGFYGGVNYGFGYSGVGFRGGYWRGGSFVVNRTVINNVTVNRVSYNGGAGGLAARPNAAEMAAEHEHHVEPLRTQRAQQDMASHDRSMRASFNGGHPAIAATPRPGVFSGHGVVAARNNTGGSFRADRPMQSRSEPARSEARRSGGSAQTHGGAYPQSRGFEPGRGQPGRPAAERERGQPREGAPREERGPQHQEQGHQQHQARASEARPERAARPERQGRTEAAPRPERQARGGGQAHTRGDVRQARGSGDRGEHGHG